MTGRILLLAALLASLLAACREDRPRPQLSSEEEAILSEKADEKVGLIIRQNLPALFAGLVVFRSDAFLTQSEMMANRNLSVLDSFGNAALVLLNSPDIPPLLKEPSVRKIYYFCRQGPLARLHPEFLMEILKRFGEGKENEQFSILVRFRDIPRNPDEMFVEAAGFAVSSRAGFVWSLTGPLTSLPRLLEDDRILFYEGASKLRTM